MCYRYGVDTVIKSQNLQSIQTRHIGGFCVIFFLNNMIVFSAKDDNFLQTFFACFVDNRHQPLLRRRQVDFFCKICYNIFIMAFTLTPTQREVLTNLSTQFQLHFIILHGSYATDKATPQSDLDIAVVSQKKLNSEQFLSLHHKLMGLFDEYELDFKVLDKTDPLFRYEVTRDGQLLVGDATEYEEYKAVSRRMYDDAKPLFDLEKILILKNQQHFKTRYAQP